MAKYSIEQIQKHKFNATLNGYNPEEVDIFIDELIEDIKEYQEIIAKLQGK
ncbi:DivIVA domain-containing protein [Mycoplasma zalophi]|uniref:DivIVA domain-containing protein n=1 Tax=Mycoplasma zalophi TaxID=191287 RepID=A0ABS6DQ67_9MOLU|nr:DivIVA domain-containing protein [Mycoplasma zalophi]MBU4690721.1 DivIVA domain-containing protein [Mycoplasma zalophi]MBU4692464.1 DivIVA domain-containing protein [Mycoplasma zalophi]